MANPPWDGQTLGKEEHWAAKCPSGWSLIIGTGNGWDGKDVWGRKVRPSQAWGKGADPNGHGTPLGGGAPLTATLQLSWQVRQQAPLL